MSAKLCEPRFSTDAVFDSFYFSAEDEAEVAAVLFRLPDLIRKFESVRRFPSRWGAKKRRSVPPENAKLDYVSTSPTSPLTFSSHADLPPSEFKEVRDSEVCCDQQMPELQLLNRSQPLVQLPDLNVPATEEYAQYYYMPESVVESRAEAAALARRRRHLIQKSKRATRGGR